MLLGLSFKGSKNIRYLRDGDESYTYHLYDRIKLLEVQEKRAKRLSNIFINMLSTS